MAKKINTYIIRVKGLVQGVGFRPFVYRIATFLKLEGSVENRNDGVFIKINSDEEQLSAFIKSLKEQAPPASYIESVKSEITTLESFSGFQIIKSKNMSDSITDISPDIAVCEDCLYDMKHQFNRINYPFINCTNCGPRFTIIKNLPYDRGQTTMQDFTMCPDCHQEYTNIHDRRFHAQPIACNNCGPIYSLHHKKDTITNIAKITSVLAQLLDGGKIAAVKGMGGFFMACDALNEEAVKKLRYKKNRESKPFAVMFKNLESVKDYAYLNSQEIKSLTSFRRPIVLLETRQSLAASVAKGFNTLGVMLPYMPVHYLLFEKLQTPVIVLTSGNITDEPIVTDNKTAIEKLGKISDAVLTYNRDIYNRNDDSVVSIINGKERLFRRSRGYAPAPIIVDKNVEGILATGAELTNSFALGRENKVLLSQHIGDLKNFGTYEFYTETLRHYQHLFRFVPKIVASDKHPNYFSTRYAEETGIRHLKIQHHHAHIASCMAEHQVNEKVIGIALDGTGYGDDGHIWGSEFMICDFLNYDRITHFEYIPLPGGDKVTYEPWRTAISYLYKYYGKDFQDFDMPFLKTLNSQEVNLLCHAIDKKINTPLSCGAGRLFDAVSALINVCPVSKFHAEAPMRLEAIIDKSVKDSYPFGTSDLINFKTLFDAIIQDILSHVAQSTMASKFHNTIVRIIITQAKKISKISGIKKIVLSGGSFQNKYILTETEIGLRQEGFTVYSHERIPTNDAGIALGQLMIAAHKADLM